MLFAVFLWGGNNTGVKVLVTSWPPAWVGATRFFLAGLLLLALLRWTNWLGRATPLTQETNRELWRRGTLSLAAYTFVFNWALKFTSPAHVALYLAASPVWALLLEGTSDKSWRHLLHRYGSAALTLLGVLILFWPALKASHGHAGGELLGLLASFAWTQYARDCRVLGRSLTGADIAAHTMWRSGALLLPLAGIEVLIAGGVVWRTDLIVVQSFCIIAGGVVAFALWNNGLRHWPVSRVFLFFNLIPLSTSLWSRVWLKEPILPTFWVAMVLVASGVILGQMKLGAGVEGDRDD